MAEAVTSPSSTPKFYCYTCNEEVQHVQEDFTCPICNGGFIEEVQETSGGGRSATGSDNSSTSNFDFGGATAGFDFLQLLRGLSDPTGSGGGGGGRGAGPAIRFPTNQNPANFQRTRSEGGNSSGGTNNPGGFSFVLGPSSQGRGGGGGTGATGRSNPNLDNPMEHVLFTFLNDLIHGLGGSGAVVGGQGTGAPLLSNIGDYAWGRDGLDAIVTQLMNQMEGTGPPPLATDKIDTLPDVTIIQEQVDRKMQCSVCWDDFNLGEAVKKLECGHVYHPDCIIPWLKLHGTCPICRKDLTGQIQEGTNDTPSARFEPMNLDNSSTVHSSETTSSSNLNNAVSSNATHGGGSNAASTGRNHHASHIEPSSSMSNPLLQFLTEFAGPGTNNASNNPPNSSGRRQQGPDQQQLPTRPPRRDRSPRGGQEHDFDNMDLEFD